MPSTLRVFLAALAVVAMLTSTVPDNSIFGQTIDSSFLNFLFFAGLFVLINVVICDVANFFIDAEADRWQNERNLSDSDPEIDQHNSLV